METNPIFHGIVMNLICSDQINMKLLTYKKILIPLPINLDNLVKMSQISYKLIINSIRCRDKLIYEFNMYVIMGTKKTSQ